MPLIVEDGSGVADADSYTSLEDFKAYADSVGFDYASYSETQLEQAIRRATKYVDSLGTIRPCLWIGVRTKGSQQGLLWPRIGATDSDGNPVMSNEIPSEIIQASQEASFREATSPNSLNPDYVLADTFKSAKVGPLEVEYATSSEAGVIPTKPVIGIIDALVKQFLSCYGNLAPVYVV